MVQAVSTCRSDYLPRQIVGAEVCTCSGIGAVEESAGPLLPSTTVFSRPADTGSLQTSDPASPADLPGPSGDEQHLHWQVLTTSGVRQKQNKP